MPLLAYCVIAILARILWKAFRGYLAKSPLDSIPGPVRTSFWRGNQGELFNRHAWDFHDEVGEKYGRVVKFHGPFGSRGLYVFDRRALNSVVVKDQNVYEEPRWFIEGNLLYVGPSLVATEGAHHRRQRKLLNPVFSTAHMRQITPLFYEVTHRLRDAISKQILASDDVDMLGWMGRCALELIGKGGLGYSFDPLVNYSPNAYGDALKEFFPALFKIHSFRVLIPFCVRHVPLGLRRLVVPWIPHGGIQRLRELTMIMDQQTRRIFADKKAAMMAGDEAVISQIHQGADILSVLMRANVEASDEERLPEDEIIAQISSLTLAGMDTTSNALARTLQLLSENPRVQDKLREELSIASIDEADIPYDKLHELPYLDAVCRETLRLYPPVTFMNREARADIMMPLDVPMQGVDGSEIKEITVPKGTHIVIGIRAWNRDKAVWGEDALVWKPERWLEPAPKTLSEVHVPGIYSQQMTFLGGGRACIGFKFSQTEMKVVLSVLLRSFQFSPGAEEIYWNMATAYYPTVGRNNSKPAMYLKVAAV